MSYLVRYDDEGDVSYLVRWRGWRELSGTMTRVTWAIFWYDDEGDVSYLVRWRGYASYILVRWRGWRELSGAMTKTTWAIWCDDEGNVSYFLLRWRGRVTWAIWYDDEGDVSYILLRWRGWRELYSVTMTRVTWAAIWCWWCNGLGWWISKCLSPRIYEWRCCLGPAPLPGWGGDGNFSVDQWKKERAIILHSAPSHKYIFCLLYCRTCPLSRSAVMGRERGGGSLISCITSLYRSQGPIITAETMWIIIVQWKSRAWGEEKNICFNMCENYAWRARTRAICRKRRGDAVTTVNNSRCPI